MRTISAFSFVCVIVRTMSREKKQCQIQETPKKKNKKKMEYRKRYFGTRSHGVVAKCNTSTSRKDVCACARLHSSGFAINRLEKILRWIGNDRLRYRSSVNDKTVQRACARDGSRAISAKLIVDVYFEKKKNLFPNLLRSLS